MSVEIGMKGRAETVVTPDNTARAAGSGLAPVFATPWTVSYTHLTLPTTPYV